MGRFVDELFWTPAGYAGRLGVSDITLRRWKRAQRLPEWARRLITLLDGELDQIDRAFKGWAIRGGVLVSPENWRFSPGDIRSIPLLRAWREEELARRLPCKSSEPVQLSFGCFPYLPPPRGARR